MTRWQYDGNNDRDRFERFQPKEKRRKPTDLVKDQDKERDKPLRGGKREMKDERIEKD